jgi:hypothetical protein
VALRTRHLACLFLLLSTMGASQANASRAPRRFCGDRITAQLYREAVHAHHEQIAQILIANTAADSETFLLPAPGRAVLHSAWTMRPPAAHSASVAAATSFDRILL